MLNCPFKGLRGKRSSQWCFRWQSSVVDLSLLRCFVVHPAVFPLRSRSTTAGDWLWLVALLYHHPSTFVCVLLPVSGDITHITLLLLCSLITSVFALLTNELCRYRLYKKKWFGFLWLCVDVFCLEDVVVRLSLTRSNKSPVRDEFAATTDLHLCYLIILFKRWFMQNYVLYSHHSVRQQHTN